jgi:hypothetical protein
MGVSHGLKFESPPIGVGNLEVLYNFKTRRYLAIDVLVCDCYCCHSAISRVKLNKPLLFELGRD